MENTKKRQNFIKKNIGKCLLEIVKWGPSLSFTKLCSIDVSILGISDEFDIISSSINYVLPSQRLKTNKRSFYFVYENNHPPASSEKPTTPIKEEENKKEKEKKHFYPQLVNIPIVWKEKLL